jgi:uncharacterized protein with HEPN domain
LSGSDSAAPDSDFRASPDRDAFYLRHMLECIEDIERYCASSNLESDQRTLDAVLRKLQILTESSMRVSSGVKAAYVQVRWRELAGFRNVVVHDYLGIRVERIWPIVNEDIPKLKEQILDILSEIGEKP